MKKILTVITISVLFVGAFTMQSCKKCATCYYTYQAPGGTDILTYTYPELCGNSGDINDYETACANAAAVYGNQCTCTD